jgi:TetR/AcrR family transcriptional repressor of lmrAB and yxaGH operons
LFAAIAVSRRSESSSITLAVAVVAGMEGALILCRAEGNSVPPETVAAELKRLLAAEA